MSTRLLVVAVLALIASCSSTPSGYESADDVTAALDCTSTTSRDVDPGTETACVLPAGGTVLVVEFASADEAEAVTSMWESFSMPYATVTGTLFLASADDDAFTVSEALTDAAAEVGAELG